MGSDDLFKKRKAKRIKDHQRKTASRAPYDRVLVICEGSKTEPLYFEGLRDYYGLHTANIEITGKCGSSPVSILAKARELFNEAKRCNNPFDRIYCVFDKDMHPNYQAIVNEIKNIKPCNTYFAITSVPCFEYWILLHFTYTNKPYTNSEDKSHADNIIAELKQFYPEYEKNNENVFINLIDKMDDAIKKARRINTSAQRNNTDNPSTKVGELVDYLRNLKK